MKNLKFSFAAIIAVVALGFTIAAQAGAFDAKPTRATDCFRPNATLRDAGCVDASFPVAIGDLCGDVAVGQHIYSLTGALVDPAQSCNSGQFICCFQIALDELPCTGQPNINRTGLPVAKYKVAAVFCKNTQN